jgi:Flp pilus assembly protein TadD
MELSEHDNPRVIEARKLVREERWKELLAYSENWIRGDAKSWLPHYFHGGAALSLGIYETAISSTIMALSLNPEDQRIWENLATAYEEKGDVARSIETLKEGVIRCRESSDVTVLLALANSFGRNKQHAEALDCFKGAWVKAPDNLGAIEGVCIALKHLGRIPDLLDWIAERAYVLPEWVKAYNEIVRGAPPLVLKWKIIKRRLQCRGCGLSFPRQEHAAKYFQNNGVLFRASYLDLWCRSCRRVTVAPQKAVIYFDESDQRELHALESKLSSLNPLMPISLADILRLDRTKNPEYEATQAKIKSLREKFLAATFFGEGQFSPRCITCWGLNVSPIELHGSACASRVPVNIDCPECKTKLDLKGDWANLRYGYEHILRINPCVEDNYVDVIGESGLVKMNKDSGNFKSQISIFPKGDDRSVFCDTWDDQLLPEK